MISLILYTVSALQARPVTKLSDNEEDQQEEDTKQEEKDLSIPGSSYVKLMALTPASVLPGKWHTHAVVKSHASSWC